MYFVSSYNVVIVIASSPSNFTGEAYNIVHIFYKLSDKFIGLPSNITLTAYVAVATVFIVFVALYSRVYISSKD